MELCRVQLTQAIAGAFTGRRGDIILIAPDKAACLARAGLAVICGDQPGEMVEPAALAAQLAADAEAELTEAGERVLAAGESPAAETAAVPPAGTPACPVGKPVPTAAAERLALANAIRVEDVPSRDGQRITRADVIRHLAGL